MQIDDRTEWLEADGLGGFASGTTSGIRTRRYHALLLTATTPPTGRVVLVNGFDAWLETPQVDWSRSRPSDTRQASTIPTDAHPGDPASHTNRGRSGTSKATACTCLRHELLVEHGTGTTLWRSHSPVAPRTPLRSSSTSARFCPAETTTRCTMRTARSGSNRQRQAARVRFPPVRRVARSRDL